MDYQQQQQHLRAVSSGLAYNKYTVSNSFANHSISANSTLNLLNEMFCFSDQDEEDEEDEGERLTEKLGRSD